MFEYGDPGAVSATPRVLDRYSPAGKVDRCGRAAVVPLSLYLSDTLCVGGNHSAGEKSEENRLGLVGKGRPSS
jgi:hypothetical protein